ncbi:MAG: glycoside hydrolase family 5 protein [Victivallales bacterium]|jgi:hypothetical protein|nr:glycoside hydrolase family 5 protein [Victivallales bacterium]
MQIEKDQTMSKFHGFARGMGIGGWLTNYKRFNVLPDEWKLLLTIGDFEHFDSYITEADVARIAAWGMDHIRLGFDQIVLEESPYHYRERTFALIDRFIAWCEKYHLNLVLNLHKAIGNYCDIPEPIALLDDPELQRRFIALWQEIERRYHTKDNIVFELLNEVRDVLPDQWNDLVAKTVTALRQMNPNRKIVVGSICWNGVAELKDLRLFDDENIIYTFHFYSPFEFTHQQGVLQARTLYYNRKMSYPDTIVKYREFRELLNCPLGDYEDFECMNKGYLRHALRGAFEFRQSHPEKILWCGEFGTIRHCKLKDRENWMNDVISLLKEYDIPYCAWNYLSTPNDGNRFSLVDDDTREILSPRLLEIINGTYAKRL